MSDQYTFEIPVRYRDLDTYGHVNNAVYATYIEDARVNYLEDVVEPDRSAYGFVVANLQLSFERPVTLGERVVVTLETTSIGRTSVSQEYELHADGELVATGETTIVTVDPDEGRPRPVPDEVRAAVAAFEGREFE